jgi:hypothetical protein
MPLMQLEAEVGSLSASFPSSSQELVANSAERTYYVTALERLLTAFGICGQIFILTPLIATVCREEDHFFSSRVQDSLAKFAEKATVESMADLLSHCMSTFFFNTHMPFTVVRNVVRIFIVPLLGFAKKPAVIAFSKRHIKDIVNLLQDDHTKITLSVLEKDALLARKCSCMDFVQISFILHESKFDFALSRPVRPDFFFFFVRAHPLFEMFHRRSELRKQCSEPSLCGRKGNWKGAHPDFCETFASSHESGKGQMVFFVLFIICNLWLMLPCLTINAHSLGVFDQRTGCRISPKGLFCVD